MKKITVIAIENAKVIMCEGRFVGTLRLNSDVYGVANLNGLGMLYAHDKDSDTWFMVKPNGIVTYPAAERFVKNRSGLGYVKMG